MKQFLRGNQYVDAVEKLYGSDVKTKSDRVVIRICQVSAFVASLCVLTNPFINKFPSVVQNTVLIIFAITALTAIATYCVMGIRSAGRSAGKKTLLLQTWYVLARVTLYVLLPCIVFTLLLVIWAMLTNQPAFS